MTSDLILIAAALVVGWAAGGAHCLNIGERDELARLNRFDLIVLRIFCALRPH